MRIKSATVLLFSVLVFGNFASMVTAKVPENNEPKVILKTPPAPKFTDAERQQELARRRGEVAKAMGPGSMLILFSSEPRIYTNDVDFMYRQENNLFYLTSLKQDNAYFVLINNAGKTEEYLFLPKRVPQAEIWNGKMYSNEEAQRLSGIKTIIDAREFKAFAEAVKLKQPFTSEDKKVTINTNTEKKYLLHPESGDAREYKREGEFIKSMPDQSFTSGEPFFASLRLIKSPYEIKMMQHAIDITTEAQMRAMAMVGKAQWEYEVQAEVEYVFRRRNADYWGYPSIVGCGPNATTLHYVESQGEVKDGDLLLMDVGAEYEHYTADVTRTFPVNGKFTKEQAEIYQIVYDAQEAAAAAAAKPGAKFSDASRAVDKVIKEGLAKLGLITPNGTVDGVFNGQSYPMEQHRLWYMHGFGHWLGMNVHDVGNYGTAFKPGMIFTNEPGIYIREDALDNLAKTPANEAFIAKVKPVFEKYKNIGVRIEDDMLITETGVEWMTKKLPRSIVEIEAFMAKASKEVQYTAFVKEVVPGLIYTNEVAKDHFGYTVHPQGKTQRTGWVVTGKDIVRSADGHKHHTE